MLMHLENFFSVISTKLAVVNEVDNLYGRVLANQFNSLDFWYLGENKVSQILAFFLNPQSNHGHGDLYLKLFIKHLEIDFAYSDFRKVNVAVEKRTDQNRRLDILIDYDGGKKLLGIENKIYENTTDGPNQLDHYLKYLQSESKDSYCLLYLSPKKKILGEHSINSVDKQTFLSSGNLRLINYEDHVIGLIHEFAVRSENERVRAFLLDFERKLIKNYMGEQSLDDSKAVVDYISETERNIGIAFRVGNSLERVKADLKELLLDQLSDLATELGIVFDRASKKFELKDLSDSNVTISYEMGGLLYGLTRKVEDKTKSRMPEIERLFDEKFLVSPWWFMYRPLYEGIEVRPQFWMDLKNGTVKEKLRKFITTIMQRELRSQAI